MEKNLFFYSYSKCSTCRKASKWLDNHNIKYQFIDIIQEPPSKKFLKLALDKFSLDKKKIFNVRGKSFKLLDLDFKNLTNERIIELLSNDGKLIKRPFIVINESKLILGYDECEYAANF